MWFWNTGDILWGELTTKKQFLRHVWCKIVVLLKQGDRTGGQKELHWAYEEQLIIFYLFGGGKLKRRFSYPKEDLRDTRDLAIVKLELFFSLAPLR